MKRSSTSREPVRATVGFALGTGTDGVAYLALSPAADLAGSADRVVRIPFTCVAMPALEGRDVSYAALLAVTGELRRRGVQRVRIETEARALVEDHVSHRALPAALSVPYVMFGCALNRFASVELAANDATCRDLTARARADASLHVAA